MVTFNKDSFTITIQTGGNPIENWLDLNGQLTQLLSAIDNEEAVRPTPWMVINLLSDMMPDWETAKKMTDK